MVEPESSKSVFDTIILDGRPLGDIRVNELPALAYKAELCREINDLIRRRTTKKDLKRPLFELMTLEEFDACEQRAFEKFDLPITLDEVRRVRGYFIREGSEK